MEDLYKTLEVSEKATLDDIKKSFRTLSKKYHPDVNQGNKEAEDKFKQINNAYSILGDEEKRKNYDNKKNRSPFEDFNRNGRGYARPEYGRNPFEDFVRNGQNYSRQTYTRPKQPVRGDSLRIQINLTLEEVFSGVTKKIKYNKKTYCESCKGNGSKDGNSRCKCYNCDGSGINSQYYNTPFGKIENATTCAACQGKGTIITNKCDNCNGHGLIDKQEEIELSIPIGINDNFIYTIEKGGNDSSDPSGDKGDLQILCHIAKHNSFNIKHKDIHKDIYISMIDAIIGNDNFHVKLIDGDISVKIAPNSDNGHVLRIKGRGIPRMNGGDRGDLFLVINIYVPKDLSEDNKNKLKELEQILKPDESNTNINNGMMNKSLIINNLIN